MTTATFVAKRFLQGAAGDLVNADYVVRLFVNNGKLFADMMTGPTIELQPLPTTAPLTPAQLPTLPVKLVNL